MNPIIIETRGLSLGYGKKRVLDGIDLGLRQGEWAVIAGRNGVGKSTLLRALAGVLLPDAGGVLRSPAASPARIGFLSDRLSLFEDWTVGRSIAFHCRVFQAGSFDDRLLRRLGVGGRRRIRDLSAGERAIVHLSLVLSQKPALLLVDEVLQTLDPFIRDLFVEALIEFIAHPAEAPGGGAGGAVVTVNHTVGEIARLPDRVLVMEEGRFVVDDSPEALRSGMKKIVGRGPLPAGMPCLFQKDTGSFQEFYVYPFQEEWRSRHSLEFQDIDLPEIVKAFIGGGYDRKRMA